MSAEAAPNRGASQPATAAPAPDVDAWEKEDELAATRRAGEALRKAYSDVGDDVLSERFRSVYFLLQLPGASRAAKAYRLVEDITRNCPERAQTSVKAVAKEVRDVLVLRCLCEMQREDHANRDFFIVTLTKAFEQTISEECINLMLHAHRKVTRGKPGAFLSKTQRRKRHRNRRARPTPEDVQLRQEINSAVAMFLAGEDVSDGASGSDEAEAARPHPHVRATAEDVRHRQEINSADAVYYPDDGGNYRDDDLWRPC